MNYNSLHQFGYESVGPVVNFFMFKLHSYISQCNRNDCKILFATRAGIRIKDVYQKWLAARGVALYKNMEVLRISRILAIKAAYATNTDLAVTTLGREFKTFHLKDIVSSLLNTEISNGIISEIPNIKQEPLHLFLRRNDTFSGYVNDYLLKQSKLYDSYFSNLSGNAKCIIYVDSGWRGTSQLLLENTFPDFKWSGLYFGCIGRSSILGKTVEQMIGLIFDSAFYQPDKPETAFVVHRHFIESLFEPNIPTVDHINFDDTDAWLKKNDVEDNETRDDWDAVFDGVCDYLVERAVDPISSICTVFKKTMDNLANILCYPKRAHVPYVSGKTRSHDLGRQGSIPSVFLPVTRFTGDDAELRIQQAIWQPGQAAIEFSEDKAKFRQKQLLTAYMDSGTDCSEISTLDLSSVYPVDANSRHVAIITRTKNRPIFLERAAKSVSAQIFDDYSWIIVNDGGCLDDVRQIVKKSSVDPTKILICSNSESLGMEAASNFGIKSSKSDYIVVHDDDDSWHPNFLFETMNWMGHNFSIYGGVIAKTAYVSEEVSNNSIVEHLRRPYNEWVVNVQLSEMIVDNFFPPISFLFKRTVWDKLGGFNETLPVLGDWDFNIRFLMECDIGVLPKTLAYYHHRDRVVTNDDNSNSVICGRDKHAAYNAIIRNNYIREAFRKQEYSSIAILMGMGHIQNNTRHLFERTEAVARSTKANVQGICEKMAAENQMQILLKKQQEYVNSLELELDRRWVLLHAAYNDIINKMNYGCKPKDLIDASSNSIGDHIASINFSSPPDFDEAEYFRENQDVYESFVRGCTFSAFDHYMKYGKDEKRRRPTAVINHTVFKNLLK